MYRPRRSKWCRFEILLTPLQPRWPPSYLNASSFTGCIYIVTSFTESLGLFLDGWLYCVSYSEVEYHSLCLYSTATSWAVPVFCHIYRCHICHPILLSVPNNIDLQRIPHPRHSIVRQQGRQGRSIQAEWPVAPSLVLKFK